MQFALFENTKFPKQLDSYLFTKPEYEICIFNKEDINSALAKINQLSQQGYYLAGYVAYDAVFALNEKLIRKVKNVSSNPILHFMAYRHATRFCSEDLFSVLDDKLGQRPTIPQTSAFIKNFKLEYDYQKYQEKFYQVKQHLEQGDTYQLNLTLRANFTSTIDLFSLYYHLSRSQRVRYASYLPFEPETVISISPELFFKKNKNYLHVKPMKGTAPRTNDALANQQYYEWLQQDQKNLAENLIIVDLLRNDLAKICHTGSVEPIKLFKIETYETVYQMVSHIRAQVNPDILFSELIKALFPCGSITGAPKLSTMQIIEAVEDSARGIYTGAIGYILPNNDMCFNVAIRTLTGAANGNILTLGSGGGVTVKSIAQEEWEEIKMKLRFVTQFISV